MVSVRQKRRVQRRRVSTKRNEHKKTMLRRIVAELLNARDEEKNLETSWRRKKRFQKDRGSRGILTGAGAMRRQLGKDTLRTPPPGVPQERRLRGFRQDARQAKPNAT